jgi:hypothetical protein
MVGDNGESVPEDLHMVGRSLFENLHIVEGSVP